MHTAFKTSNLGNSIRFSNGDYAANTIEFNSTPEEYRFLSVYTDDGALFNFYNGVTNVLVDGMGDNDCNPVGLRGGSIVTSLNFNNCARNGGGFAINNISNLPLLPLLNSLSFNYCGFFNGDFALTNTAGMENLKSLSFSNCAYGGNFSLPDTSGLTNLESLSFYTCSTYNGGGGNTFTLDTSGLTNLKTLSFGLVNEFNGVFSLTNMSDLASITTLSFRQCGLSNGFNLPTSPAAVGVLDSLTSIRIDTCGTVQETQFGYILNALVSAGNYDGVIDVIGTSLQTASISSDLDILSLRGWRIRIPGYYGPPVSTDYLTVYRSDNTLFRFYDGITNVLVDNIQEANPVGLAGGELVTSLSFSNSAQEGEVFELDGSSWDGLLSNLTSLSFDNCGKIRFTLLNARHLGSAGGYSSITSVSFNNCGYYNYQSTFSADLTYLTNLQNLSFDGCGYETFSFDTSGLGSLQTLSFANCANGSSGFYLNFSLPNMQSLTALTTLSFNNCGLLSFDLPSNSAAVGSLQSLVSLTFNECPLKTSELNLILDKLVIAGNTGGSIVANDISGGILTSLTNIGTLISRNWNITTNYVYLSVYDNTGTFNNYNNLTNITVNGMSDDVCSPVSLLGGSSVTHLNFNNCAELSGNFSLNGISQLTSLLVLNFSNCASNGEFTFPDITEITELAKLQSLTFSNCGRNTFSMGDIRNLTSLTNLSFANCALFGVFSISNMADIASLETLNFTNCGFIFELPDISGLSKIAGLNFDGCGYLNFSISKMSGLTSISSLTINNCGTNGFSLPNNAADMRDFDNLIIISITNCGTLQESQIDLILDAVIAAENYNGSITINNASGTSSLQTKIATLQSRGWSVNIS